MTVNTVKNNFVGGELDPELHSRADLPQWRNGCRTARNVELRPQGGFRRRRGSRFVEELAPQIERVTAGVTITTPRGGTGANANDGDETTGMTTSTSISTLNPYVVVHYDLGSATAVLFADVVGFRISSGSDDNSDFFIQYSTDNVTFVSLGLAIPVGNDTLGERTRRRTGPITARYWRFARIGATDYGSTTVSIREFNLWTATASLSEHRFVSHDFSASQKFMLVFTDRNARVYEKVNGVPARQADIRTAFTSAQLSKLNWAQTLDTGIFVHEDVGPHKIQRQGADTQWNTETVFNGFAAAAVSISAASISHTTASPDDATAGYSLTNGGAAQKNGVGTGGIYVDINDEEWHFPRRTIVAGEFEVRATLSSGTTPTSGTIGSWEDLGSSRTWENVVTTDGNDSHTSTLLIEIRNAVTQVVLDAATIVITATVSL